MEGVVSFPSIKNLLHTLLKVLQSHFGPLEIDGTLVGHIRELFDDTFLPCLRDCMIHGGHIKFERRSLVRCPNRFVFLVLDMNGIIRRCICPQLIDRSGKEQLQDSAQSSRVVVAAIESAGLEGKGLT